MTMRRAGLGLALLLITNLATAQTIAGPVKAGECAVVVQLEPPVAAETEIELQINKKRLPRVAAGGQTDVRIALTGPLGVGDELRARLLTASTTDDVEPGPVMRVEKGDGPPQCEAPSNGEVASDLRQTFEASGYVGMAIDNFAPASVGGYENSEAGGRQTRVGGGFDFEFRVAGTPTSKRQIWIFGETLHGVRSADINCAPDNSDKPAVCDKLTQANFSKQLQFVLENATSMEAYAGFVMAVSDRPFLIVGGTIIYQHPAFDYPRLVPVEYTPMYTGVRQQYGDRLGGTYVTPYAYDAASVDQVRADRVRVTLKSGARPFMLSDVIASSGAAPLLAFYRGAPADALERATAFFPSFNHFSIRDSGSGLEAKPVVADLLHGDGGFSDNLGVMPLLARQVHNIIVFVNGSEPFATNLSVESMFWRLQRVEDFGGDRSMNGVFDSAKFWEVDAGLKAAVEAGGPAVYCGRNWHVASNELYNIAAYDGLNICWVHNERIEAWTRQLPDDTQALITSSKGFRNFPWFKTFEQNAPTLIRLTPAQVNLLAALSSWTVTSAAGRSAIEAALGAALQ